jgi:signal peptidase I
MDCTRTLRLFTDEKLVRDNALWSRLHPSTVTALRAVADEELPVSDRMAAGVVVEANGVAVPVDDDAATKSRVNTTLTLPASFHDLWSLRPGECVVSDTIVLHQSNESFDFCVQLYPRGCTKDASRAVAKSGFGMSAALSQLLSSRKEETVDVYVQFLPRHVDQMVDASFCVRLLGRQTVGRRFDVEWRAGMRFVHASKCQLSQGQAPDFGSRLLHTALLPTFLGVRVPSIEDEPDQEMPIRIQLSIQLHKSDQVRQDPPQSTIRDAFSFRDLRKPFTATLEADGPPRHDTEQVRVGRLVVPVLQRLSQRARMFAQGAYPGVEYRILRIHNGASSNVDWFYSRPRAYYDIKPVYPLVAQLERPWPVTICETDIPMLVSPQQYNAISALGSLATALTGLLAAFIISQAISLYYIPSRSMDPTLSVGDVLLVEKVSPQWRRLISGLSPSSSSRYHLDEVVLFSPPERLRDLVSLSGGRLGSRDLFVKRIAALPGDTFAVNRQSGAVQTNGQPVSKYRRDLCAAEPLGLIQTYLSQASTTLPQVVPDDTVQVLGDCSFVSIDSRVWGPLPVENIVGRPIVRLWPLSKFGPVPLLPPLSSNWGGE